jgi:hypothetical protein
VLDESFFQLNKKNEIDFTFTGKDRYQEEVQKYGSYSSQFTDRSQVIFLKLNAC